MSPKKAFVTLTYASPGAVPPIFLAGSFSEPAWHTQEMGFRADEKGELQFHKEVQVEEGAQYQYKFRIGTGEWWALNEQAPTVTDEIGNRNNLLTVPITMDIVEESSSSASDPAPPVSEMPNNEVSIDKTSHSEPVSEQMESKLDNEQEVVDKYLPMEPVSVSSVSETTTPEKTIDRLSPSVPGPALPASNMPVPELVVGKVDEEPRHGEDFGLNATVGQRDAHEMRPQDAQPDLVLILSETETPVYATTAAEVADSAAILDREPSPVLVSDEEAGRTGERRMSSTPIPQVALTAAEVADIAMIIDQDDEDDMRINMPHPNYPFDTSSGPATPWHERAPLFAHECLGPNDGVEVESPVAYDGPQSPIKPKPEEELIDMNDPLLEHFPEDRMSILTHIRSTESRMNEDETSINGVPPSPINGPKGYSPSSDTPGSARLGAQPSPSLGIIAEENHESESHFGGFQAPVDKMHDQIEAPKAEELDVIHEAEEPAEEPDTAQNTLKKVESSTEGSNKAIQKDKGAEPGELEELKPVEESDTAEKKEVAVETNEEVLKSSEMEELKSSEGPGAAKEPGLINDTDNQIKDMVIGESIKKTIESTDLDKSKSIEGLGDKVEQNMTNEGNEHTVTLDDGSESMKLEVTNTAEDLELELAEIGVPDNSQLYEASEESHVGLKDVPTSKQSQDLELLEEPKKELAEDLEHREDVKEIKESETAQEPVEQHHTGDTQPGEDLEQNANSVEPTQAVESHNVVELDPSHPPPSQESQPAAEASQMEKSAQIVVPHLAEHPGLNSVNGVSIGEVIVKDLPAATNIQVRDSGQSSDPQRLTPRHDILESESQESASALGNPQPGIESYLEEELPSPQIQAVDKAPANCINSTTLDSNDLEEVDETRTNGFDNVKSTAVDDPSPNGHDTSKLKLSSTMPNLERPLTPSSIRSAMKRDESRNFFKAIWRTVFIGWIGGIIASLCGGERGPLLAVSALFILGPLFAMYLYRPQQAL